MALDQGPQPAESREKRQHPVRRIAEGGDGKRRVPDVRDDRSCGKASVPGVSRSPSCRVRQCIDLGVAERRAASKTADSSMAMSSPVPSIPPHASPPVHQHRTWRHLQRAAVAAHPQLSAVTQANFCSLMAPAASVAVWMRVNQTMGGRLMQLGARAASSRQASWPMRQVAAPRAPH